MAVLYREPAAFPVPARYHVIPAKDSAPLLGSEERAWQAAARIEWGPGAYRTRFRACWSPDALLIRFDCVDASPWHTMQNRDDPLWNEEVVEIFIDPASRGTEYAEIEISPANVVCDLRILQPFPDLHGDLAWNFADLESRVCSWREDTTGEQGWTALASLPWQGFRSLSPAAAAAVPAGTGSVWRFNVFRIKRPCGPGDPERDSIYAAWSVPDGPSFHVPAAFRDMVFV
jgi:hypothetical protein